jgi:hypothetical protein
MVIVYPNPATDVLNINPLARDQFQEAELYNIHGQKVLTSGLTNSIDISSLPKGQYFLLLKAEKNAVETIKIQKE